MKILMWNNYPISINGLMVTVWSAGWCAILLAARDMSGKRHFEVDVFGGSSSFYSEVGYFYPGNALNQNYWIREDHRGGCYAMPGGSVSCPGYSANSTVRIMCAYDLDAGKIWFGNNGTWVNGGNPATGANPQYANLASYRGGYQGVSLAGNGYRVEFIEPAAFSYMPAGFSAPTEFPMTARLPPSPLRRDVIDGGPFRIIEPITRLNSIPPAPRRVRLCDQKTGRLVREQWSNPTTGLVTFENVREGPWVLYALDHTNEFEAVAISDRIATPDGSRP